MVDINRFTNYSQELLSSANTLVSSYKNTEMQPEHLLLAMIKDNGTIKDYLNELNKPVQSTQSSSISVGDKVKVKTTATHYATGQSMASFVKGSTYEVTRIDGNKLLLADIVSWVWDYDVECVSSTTQSSSDTSFLVEIICSELNIRKSDSFNSAIVGTVKKGEVFTIVEESNGLGRLKSGAGWISIGSAYVKRK